MHSPSSDTNNIEVLRKVIHWAESRCPCKEETPDPCTLCGATVAEGTCKAVESIFRRDLLRDLRDVLSASASAPETLRCKQCGNEWPDYLLSSGSCIKCKKATPPAHGDGEGEIVGEVVMCDGYEAGVQVYKPHLVVRWAKRYMPAVGTKLYAAPQPAQTGASGRVRIKTKGPDDFASHVCPAESSAVWNACVYEHDRIAEGLPPILSSTEVTPASPSTGDDPCIECGADPGEACYPNCCTQTPQPAAPQPQEKE